jgi:hypothetical protein
MYGIACCLHPYQILPKSPVPQKSWIRPDVEAGLPFYFPKTQNLTENIRYTGNIASVINSIEEALHETPTVAEMVEEHPAI